MVRKILNRLFMYLSRSIDNHTTIGKNTFIAKNVTITKAEIGNYCSIAPNVSIGLGEHHVDRISTSSFNYQNEYEELTIKEVIIGHNIWIGTHSVILRGVKIGNGAIIGAGSIVTKDIPPYAIVTGIPAKIMRYRFNSEEIKIIEESKWWEMDKSIANIKLEELQDKVDLLKNRKEDFI